jgi:hypothetical protein
VFLTLLCLEFGVVHTYALLMSIYPVDLPVMRCARQKNLNKTKTFKFRGFENLRAAFQSWPCVFCIPGVACVVIIKGQGLIDERGRSDGVEHMGGTDNARAFRRSLSVISFCR